MRGKYKLKLKKETSTKASVYGFCRCHCQMAGWIKTQFSWKIPKNSEGALSLVQSYLFFLAGFTYEFSTTPKDARAILLARLVFHQYSWLQTLRQPASTIFVIFGMNGPNFFFQVTKLPWSPLLSSPVIGYRLKS